MKKPMHDAHIRCSQTQSYLMATWLGNKWNRRRERWLRIAGGRRINPLTSDGSVTSHIVCRSDEVTTKCDGRSAVSSGPGTQAD